LRAKTSQLEEIYHIKKVSEKTEEHNMCWTNASSRQNSDV